MSRSPPNALLLCITLAGIDPPIWRRLVAPGNQGLDQLRLGILRDRGRPDAAAA
jgi:hypothetical protein